MTHSFLKSSNLDHKLQTEFSFGFLKKKYRETEREREKDLSSINIKKMSIHPNKRICKLEDMISIQN